MLSTLERSIARAARERLGAARIGSSAVGAPSSSRGFATHSSADSEPVAPSSSSSSSSPRFGSESAPSAPIGSPEHNAAEVEALWDRVLRTPSSIVNSNNRNRDRPGVQDLLSRSTPLGRTFKGTMSRMHRALGQTPAEERRVRDSLRAMFQDLNARMLRPDQGGDWGDMLRAPSSMRRRVEDEDPQLRAQTDAKAEALAMLTSPAEVVAWAEEHVFTRQADADGPATRAGYVRTYPRLLAAVMRHLRSLAAPHLALAMFANARALGVESYLAGCQTSAFNELLRTRWEAFRDLAGVVAAVQEMEAHAVAWDRTTNSIVTSVINVVGQDLLHRRDNQWGGEAFAQLRVLEKAITEDTRREAEMYQRRVEEKRLFRHKTRVAAQKDRWGHNITKGYPGQRDFEARRGAHQSEYRNDDYRNDEERSWD